MTNKTTALAEKQRARILNAAKKCFIEHGLTHTTMRDIAAQADMSLGNIYRYFKNKETLLEAYVAADNQEIGEVFALLDNAKNFNNILKDIGCEIIKEIANKAELMVYTDILSEALRNDKVLSLIALDDTEIALAQCIEKAIIEQRTTAMMNAELTAFTIMAFIEKSALKCVTDKKYSIRTAKKQFKAYIDIVLKS